MSNPRENRKIADLFTEPEHENVLSHFLGIIPDGAIFTLLRLCKHVNTAFTRSPKPQLYLRKIYHGIHALPSSTQQPADQITELLTCEKRLEALTPDSIQCLHFPHGDVVEVKHGLMLVADTTNKVYVNEEKKQIGYEKDGWSVIQLGEDKAGEKRPGGDKIQGLRRWKLHLGQRVDGMAMCVEDNVLVIATAPMYPVHTYYINDNQLVIRRIHFYMLRPAPHHPDQPDFRGWSAIPHPDAFAPFIDLVVPNRYGLMNDVKLQAVPGGRMAIQQELVGDARETFVGAWDWKAGLSVGRVSPSCQTTTVSSFQCINTSTIVCSTFRRRDASRQGEDRHPGELGHELPKGDGDLLCCLDVYGLASVGNGYPPDNSLYEILKTLKHYKVEGDIPSAWHMQNIIYGCPLVSYDLPRFVDHSCGHINGPFAPIDCEISADCLAEDSTLLYSTSVLTFTLKGYADHSRYFEGSFVSLTGTVPILHFMERASAIGLSREIKDFGAESIREALDGAFDIVGKQEKVEEAMARLMKGVEGLGAGSEIVFHHEGQRVNLPNPGYAVDTLDATQYLGTPRPVKPRHYHLHHYPWSEWSDHLPITLTKSPIGHGRAGSKVISIEVDKVHHANADSKGGIVVAGCKMVLRDYNLNRDMSGGETFLDRPLGSLSEPGSGDQHLRPTRIIECPLTRPIELPKLDCDDLRYTTFHDGSTEYGKRVFKECYISERCYAESSRRMELDPSRPLKGIFYDGKTVVLAMRSGANIMKF